MAKQVPLAARPRTGSGTGEARSLRRQGRVPAIAYGSDLEATPISVDALELYHALRTDAGLNAIFRLDMDGHGQLAMAREIQRHAVRKHILHVDFVTVSRNVKVTVDVPVVLEGEAPGQDEGGIADQQLHTVSVEVLPLEVPEHFTLDISDMQIGDVKRVSDLDLPAGVDLLDDPERTVVSVNVPALEVPEPEEGAPLEPLEGAEAVAEEGADTPEESADAASTSEE